MHINEIELKHIENLKDFQLTQLLHNLLPIELQKNEISGTSFVPLNITTGDGGEDGRVELEDDKQKTKWLPNQFCLFQNKATKLEPAECYEEILLPPKKDQSTRVLKPRIAELVEKKGCYVLFTNYSLNPQLIENRIAQFNKAITNAGHNAGDIQIEVYDANRIKDWVNENIATITLVQGFNDITRPGFRTWDEWLRSLEGGEVPFQTDQVINDNIRAIRESVLAKRPIRIIGHSGIGKTRLVLEAFRNTTADEELDALRKQVVYFELGVDGDLTKLSTYLTSHQNQKGTIIIDSCDENAHNALSGLATSLSQFSIVTIDIATSTEHRTSIKLDRSNQRAVVREIIVTSLGTSHGSNDIDYLNQICEGYPWMAVRFCKSIQENGIKDFNSSLPNEFIFRLLFDTNPQERKEYEVIRACSVFSTFGYLDDELRPILNETQKKTLQEQMDFVRTTIYAGQLSYEEFYEICQKYRTRDILEKRGTQYMVKPTVLAINLASDWLLKTPPDKVVTILTALKGSSLSQKFVERLTDLDQLDKAQKIVQEMWGPNSPFGSAEVLNSDWGSLLFRYVVEVNPVETAKALYSAFSNKSKAEIHLIAEGRRNLVWALEKLCFRKESFSLAAKILYSFAVSENETWGNNATNQFKQLFQLFLSGTEANLQDRIDIIEFGLTKDDSDYNRIAIEALGRGLHNGDFTRMGGADKQGNSAPLIDYQPNWEEIYAYWTNAVEILCDIAVTDSINSALAKEKLIRSFRTLVRNERIDLVEQIVEIIKKDDSTLWIEAINSLHFALEIEGLSDGIKTTVNALIKGLKSDELKDQFHLFVTKPEWFQFTREDEDHLIDRPRKNAEEFANRLVRDNIDWHQHLPNILKGEQRQAFHFGVALAKVCPPEQMSVIAKLALDALELILPDQANVEFIGGIMNGSEVGELNKIILDRIFETPLFQKHAFYLLRMIDASMNELERLFQLIDNKEITIGYFLNFQFGRALEHLEAEDMLKLCSRISEFGDEGKWTSLSLLYMYCHGQDTNWIDCKDFVEKLITSSNLIVADKNSHAIKYFHWSDTISKLLTESDTPEFAKVIAKQIVEACEIPTYNYSSDSYVRTALDILLSRYFEDVWPVIAGGLLGNHLTYFHLKNLLSTRNGSWEHPVKLFDSPENIAYLLNWIRDNPEIAPKRIANMMPLQDKTVEEIQWHPFSKAVIDEFSNKEVLSELSANMGSFGSVGSSVPYYQRQRTLLELLVNHQLPIVREWAENMISYTDKSIAIEKLDDEEGSI